MSWEILVIWLTLITGISLISLATFVLGIILVILDIRFKNYLVTNQSSLYYDLIVILEQIIKLVR